MLPDGSEHVMKGLTWRGGGGGRASLSCFVGIARVEKVGASQVHKIVCARDV